MGSLNRVWGNKRIGGNVQRDFDKENKCLLKCLLAKVLHTRKAI